MQSLISLRLSERMPGFGSRTSPLLSSSALLVGTILLLAPAAPLLYSSIMDLSMLAHLPVLNRLKQTSHRTAHWRLRDPSVAARED